MEPRCNIETVLENVQIVEIYSSRNCFQTWITELYSGRTSMFKRNSLHPEDGGSKVLQNVGILPHCYTGSQPRRLQLELIEVF
jgi:hypothetical protein